MSQIRLDPKAWEAGFAAGQKGEFSNSCPYRPLTVGSLSWHAGFIEGKAGEAGLTFRRGETALTH